MKKILIVDSTNSSGAGSKGKFIKAIHMNKLDKYNRDVRAEIKVVGVTTDNGAGSKGLFALNIH